MSEPGRPSGPGSDQPQWSQPTEPLGNQYPPADPAYAGTYNYPGYVPPNTSDPTRVLPTHWTQGQQPPYPPPPQHPETPPPPPPKSPRWLWLIAAVAIVLVLGLVAALLIANMSERDETVVAPLPTIPNTATSETPSALPTTTTPAPTAVPPLPTTTSTPEAAPPGTATTTTEAAATESVVYNVSGTGRAISITYVDTGGVLQMEFNVVLPWSREVALSESTVDAASVTVVNVGRQVSCSVTVNGVEVQQHSGNGLTICAGRR
jgi:Mycobacterium membrane protein